MTCMPDDDGSGLPLFDVIKVEQDDRGVIVTMKFRGDPPPLPEQLPGVSFTFREEETDAPDVG